MSEVVYQFSFASGKTVAFRKITDRKVLQASQNKQASGDLSGSLLDLVRASVVLVDGQPVSPTDFANPVVASRFLSAGEILQVATRALAKASDFHGDIDEMVANAEEGVFNDKPVKTFGVPQADGTVKKVSVLTALGFGAFSPILNKQIQGDIAGATQTAAEVGIVAVDGEAVKGSEAAAGLSFGEVNFLGTQIIASVADSGNVETEEETVLTLG